MNILLLNYEYPPVGGGGGYASIVQTTEKVSTT